jgi:hypothetical protein
LRRFCLRRPAHATGHCAQSSTASCTHEVDEALLRQAVRYLAEQGKPIQLIGEAEVPAFEMEGQSVTASQVVL